MQNIMVKGTMDEMMLRQMGAEVILYHGLQCFVRFRIEGMEISYAYNINRKDKYFLQRLKPYSMPAGVFENVNDVVDAIKIDVDQFKNALKSKNFEKFIEINKEILKEVRVFEDFFLYYNVSSEVLDEISEDIKKVNEKLRESIEKSERVYFESEPKGI